MPLFKSILIDSQTVVKIWHITESYDWLSDGVKLEQPSIDRLKGMKSEVHQRGFLSVRHLLLDAGYTDADLYYNTFGKPHLNDGKHISITHSFEYSAVIISDKFVGIDLEQRREKIKRIAHKFCDYELQYAGSNQPDAVHALTKIWCVKEAAYKWMAKPGLSFKDHVLVVPFSSKDDTTTAWIITTTEKHRLTAHLLGLEGYDCAFIYS